MRLGDTKTSERGGTFSLVLDADKFVVQQPLDTGLDGSCIGLFI